MYEKTNFHYLTMQGQCKPKAESLLYAEVQPVLAVESCIRPQRYGKKGDFANTFNELAVFFNEKRRNRGKPDAPHSLILRLDVYYTLISTSTPLGSSSFIRASTVLAVEL